MLEFPLGDRYGFNKSLILGELHALPEHALGLDYCRFRFRTPTGMKIDSLTAEELANMQNHNAGEFLLRTEMGDSQIQGTSVHAYSGVCHRLHPKSTVKKVLFG